MAYFHRGATAYRDLFSSVFAAISVAILAAISIAGCRGLTKAELSAAPPVIEVSDLSRTETKERSQRLSNIRYDLTVDLSAAVGGDQDRFSGDLVLSFDLNSSQGAEKPLRLDFSRGEIVSIVANGAAVSREAIHLHWILVPPEYLKAGSNTISISYRQNYSRGGAGFYRFIDPIDNRIYLYTQFEPYNANRFLPCFDQPDLRAVFRLNVKAPKAWTIISVAHEERTTVQGANRDWQFPASPPIPTYLFSLHAGDYAIENDRYQRADGSSLPLRFLARQSLHSSIRKFAQHKDWFRITKQGLRFYENEFGARYPFSKLDQLVVPEFAAGGMENAAAITYAESIVARAKETYAFKRERAALILHEIAHMWFGDLVTIAWWNDLWLKESAATYMAIRAQVEAAGYLDAWTDFAANGKLNAYKADGRRTTHPVSVEVSRAREAITNFDALTYQKGAAFIKQLEFYATPEGFQKGLRDYFQKYAFKASTLQDFIRAIEDGAGGDSKRNLEKWSQVWLLQSGVDDLKFSCENSENKTASKVKLQIVPALGKANRPQALRLAIYKLDKTDARNRIVRTQTLRADFGGAEGEMQREISLKGSCPDFIYPNDDDHAYVRVDLSKPSDIQFLRAHLADIPQAPTRVLIWRDLYLQAMEPRMKGLAANDVSLRTYVELLKSGVFESRESDPDVLDFVYGHVGSIFESWPPERESEKNRFQEQLEADIARRLKASRIGSDDFKRWLGFYIQYAKTSGALNELVQRSDVLKGRPADLDREWKIAYTLSRYAHPKAEMLRAALTELDPGDRGRRADLRVQTVAPGIENKKRWMDEWLKGNWRSLAETRAIAESLFPLEQRSARLNFAPTFYDFFRKHRNSEDQMRVHAILEGFLPLACERAASVTFRKILNSTPDMNPLFKKNFERALEEDEICQKVRAAY